MFYLVRRLAADYCNYIEAYRYVYLILLDVCICCRYNIVYFPIGQGIGRNAK